VDGPVNLNRIQEVNNLVARPDLKFAPFKPSVPPQLRRNKDIFAAIKRHDILLHHPFESFSPVVEFLRRRQQRRKCWPSNKRYTVQAPIRLSLPP